MKEKFWMVFVHNKGFPTKIHNIKDEVMEEAERLAKMYPETSVYVLEVVNKYIAYLELEITSIVS